MGFITRPHFEDRQIIQYSGETITLSGGTNYGSTGQVVYSPTLLFQQPTTGDTGSGPFYNTGETQYNISGLVGYQYPETFRPGGSGLVVSPPILGYGYDLSMTGTTGTTTVDVTGYYLRSIDAYGTAVWDTVTITGDTGGSFTGNTSGDCITDLWITNLHGCSPITVHDSIQTVGSIATGLTSYSFGDGNSALGDRSFVAGGRTNIASGLYSHAEGNTSYATGDESHAEGYQTLSSGPRSHAEGDNTISSGNTSHSEGGSTVAGGDYSHAEGYLTKSYGPYSHAEGLGTIAGGTTFGAHAEGRNSQALGDASHAEGGSTAIGVYSHSEGSSTAEGDYSHAEGGNTWSFEQYSHAEGSNTIASGDTSHAEGYYTISNGSYSHAEGSYTLANGTASHASGSGTTASGYISYAEGYNTISSGLTSHSEGYNTIAGGWASHAEGLNTYATNEMSHSEGWNTLASGRQSHAEGRNTIASGDISHAEGSNTSATTDFTHSQGVATTASGRASHSSGENTIASGTQSYVGGKGLNTTSSKVVSSGNVSFTHQQQTNRTGNIGASANYSVVLGGEDNHINTNATSSGIFCGSGGTINSGVIRSVVLGGQNITGTTSDTVYVPDLVIDGLVSTDPLATDSNGKIVAGVSDERLKENIEPLSGALNKIKQLRGVSFNYTEESNMGGGLRYGFIAQEVQPIIPHIVRDRSKSDGMLNLNYTEVIPWLVEGFKELLSGGTKYTLSTSEDHYVHSNTHTISDVSNISNMFLGGITSFDTPLTVGNVIQNTDTSGNVGVFFGDFTVFPELKEYGSLAYYGGGFTRIGDELTGDDFYKNKTVLKTHENTSGMVINTHNTLWFEINGNSVGVLHSDKAYWGFGLNPNGEELPKGTVQIGSESSKATLIHHPKNVPTTSLDEIGDKGEISWDNEYMYIKTDNGWGRVPLDYNF